jgi:hypothetical protein
VIYFVLGTERSRALWLVCQRYFNPGIVEMVARMMKDAPVIDLWDRLQAIQ